MARVVGLDIGSYAVRAVELVVGGRQPVLERVAQVVLPPGAVDHGEVVDVGAVSAAVRRLWNEGGIRGRRVIVGVANQRVVVRQAEFPTMDRDDLAAALQFEAQELIPLPMEEAVLDFQILEETTTPEGDPRMAVLLAAAQREMVRNHLASVEAAGLTTTAVDVVPLALVRALAPAVPALGDRQGEAILCVGGGVTNVVVHENGVPRFVRILRIGGDDVTAAVMTELDVDHDEAEDLKRRADASSGDERLVRAAQVVDDGLTPLIQGIRGSLEFYASQPNSAPLGRILLTGGAARSARLAERLQVQLGRQVEAARPLEGVRIGNVSLSEPELARLEPLLAVPIGLALAGEVRRGVRRISLVPREVAAVRRQRRQMAGVAAGGIGLLTLLMMLWLARSAQEGRERDRAREAERRAAELRQERARLGDTTTVETELAQRSAQVRTVLADDVAWTRLFNEVATAIPSDVWLTGFTGQKGNPGTVTVQGQGFDQTSTARWLLRVGGLRSLGGLWVSSSTRQGEGPAAVVSFTSQATLTPAAVSDRAQRLAGGGE